MNFFEHQERARAQSRWLTIVFAAAVAFVVLLICGLFALMLINGNPEGADHLVLTAQDYMALLGVGGAVLAVILLSSLFKIAQLRSGGAAVARSLGATPVATDTRDPRLRRLRNVVEEIAIASGVPVPEIYVLEQEAGINAFAAGYAPADAAVTVTRGALEKLSRDELQGVVAHEFSHILNGDMRLNIRAMGVIFGLLVIFIIGRAIVGADSSGRKRDGRIVALGFGLMAVGWLGVFFGRLIKARLSRTREFLADASAVQFTRQTTGLSGALKKLAGITGGSKLASGKGEEVAHMLFGDGVGYASLFATHPPLFERIRVLDPSFTEKKLATLAEPWNQPGYSSSLDDEGALISGLAATASRTLTAEQVVTQVSHPGADDYRYAEMLHATLPEDLREASQDDREAPALLLALLLDDSNADLRQKQLEMISAAFGAALAESAARWREQQLNLHPAQRLPLASLVFPALRRRPSMETAKFCQLVSDLSLADGRIGAFEFLLGRLLRVQIGDWLAPATVQAHGKRKLAGSEDEVAALLVTLAQFGSADNSVAQRAFAAGWTHLFPQQARRYQVLTDWVTTLNGALNALDTLVPAGKQLLIEALVKTLAHDGRVTVGEAELLRVACASLHCPLPPMLGL